VLALLGATDSNPQEPAGGSRPSTDVAAGSGWDNRGMRLDSFRSERERRTVTVIELLRRRAEQRRARGLPVPPALSATLAEAGRQSQRPAAGDDRDPR